jgi:hypothetical protein
MIKPQTNSIPQVTDSSVCAVPSGAPNWVTSELIEHTIRVWQPYYEPPLTADDALAIIQSASQLFQVLSRESRP